jgi:hypothetical protein
MGPEPVGRTRAKERDVADVHRLKRYERLDDILGVASAPSPRRSAASLA